MVGACIARPQVARGLILFFIHRNYGFKFSLYRKIYGFALAKQVKGVTWGNFRERVQLQFRVIALLYAPSNLGQSGTPVPTICAGYFLYDILYNVWRGKNYFAVIQSSRRLLANKVSLTQGNSSSTTEILRISRGLTQEKTSWLLVLLW